MHLITQITELRYLKLGSLFKHRTEDRLELSSKEKESDYMVVQFSWGLLESICCWLRQRCHPAIKNISLSLLPAANS